MNKKIGRVSVFFFFFMFNFVSASETHSHQHGPFYGDSFGIDPHLNWKVIETKNFRIHYDESLKEIAIRTSQLFEEAHEVLSPLMRWQASYKMPVILADNTDSANGLAAAVLRIGVVLYLTPPENWTSIAHYEDWLKLLIIHEYTHFLNMDPTRSFWVAIRWIFGDTITPNSLWTRWMLEGLAVYIETAYTKAGRGRSSDWEMMLRAAFSENVLGTSKYVTLDRMNGEYPYPPYGEAPYFYGYHLMNQVTLDLNNKKRKRTFDREDKLESSEDILGLMSYRSAGRVPWFINDNLKNITGKTWSDYWSDFLALTRIRMREQLKIIRSEKLSEIQTLTNEESNNTILGLALSPDESFLAYSKRDKDERMHLYLRNLSDQKEKRIFKNNSGVGLSITSDSKHIFFSGLRRYSKYYTLSDIGVYDLDRNSTYWLTKGERIKDPALSPDNRFLAYAQIEKGTVFLSEASLVLDGKKWKLENKSVLFRGAQGTKVSTPVYSQDGSKIFFTFHDNKNSGESIHYYDRSLKQVRTLYQDGSLNRFLSMGKDGFLYFTSNKTGVDNIYRFHFQKMRPEMLSNVITGVRYPAVSKNKTTYVAHYSHKGWDLAQITLASTPYGDGSLIIPAPYAPSSPARVTETLSKKSYEYIEKPYSPWRSLLPRAWNPVLIPYGDKLYGGLAVTGFDTIDRHRYTLIGGYDSLLQEFDGKAVYTNRSFGPTLTLSAENFTSTRIYANSNILAYERTLSYQGFLSYTFQWTYSSFTPYVGALLQQSKFFSYFDKSKPEFVSPYIPILATGLSWTNVENQPLSISPQKGGILNLDSRLFRYQPTHTLKGFASYQQFFHLGKNHVITPVVGTLQTSHTQRGLSSSNVEAFGYSSNPFKLLSGLSLYSIDGITLRGYPNRGYILKSVYFATLEYRFPLIRIFRGPGTFPFFVRNLYGFTFGDYLHIPLGGNRRATLSAVGGGTRLTATAFHLIPLTFSAEVHYGFNKRLGGKPEAVFALIFSPTELFTSLAGSKN